MKRRVLFFCFSFLFSALVFSQTSTLPPPSNLVSSDIDANNATLRWDSDENALSWIVNYSVAQSEQVFSMEVTDTVVYITNLVEGTRYNWKVRMIDLQGDTTAWSELASFFTSGFDNNCPKVENLSVSDINANGITIQWVPEQENGTWEVVYDLAGSNPEHEGFSGTTQNHEFTANRDLIEHTRYQLAIRTHCTNTVSDWTYLYARYLTENSIHELPIQLDFENESDNLNIGFVNSVNNPWEIADAENASSIGSKAMYISNDSGETFGCDPSTYSVSYAYMDFYIPDYAVSYYIDFKYKSQTPLQNAGLKIYMISTGEPLNLTNLPNEEFRVGNVIYSGSENEWISEHIELPTQYIGTTRRLLFAWSNQTGAENNSAIAIDDIYLTARYCAVPTNLSVPSADDNSALITWNFQENQTSFNLQYKPTQSTQWTELSGISPNYVLNDLQASTSYTFRVQADCGQEQSFWSDTAVFSTNMLIESPSNVELTFVGETSALFIIAITAISPIALSISAGLRRVPAVNLRVAEMCGKSRSEVFSEVLIPFAALDFINGIRIGMANAWRMLISAEMVVGVAVGLGFAIQIETSYLDYVTAFACILLICIIGLVIDKLVLANIESYASKRLGMEASS